MSILDSKDTSEEIPAATLAYLTPIGEFIHSADGKSGTILAVLGIMFTLLARFGGWLDATLRGEGSRLLMIAALILLTGFVVSALAAVVQAFRTISPRFPKAKSSLVFFGDIGRLTPAEYRSRVLSLTPDQALSERMAYNYNGARIILLKMAQLWWALRYFEIATICWLLLAGLLACRTLLA